MKDVEMEKRILKASRTALSGPAATLAMVLALGGLQSGCASNPDQLQSDQTEAPSAEVTQAAEAQSTADTAPKEKTEQAQTEAADAMMASLAAKEKYALVEAEPEQPAEKVSKSKAKAEANTVQTETKREPEKLAKKPAPKPSVSAGVAKEAEVAKAAKPVTTAAPKAKVAVAAAEPKAAPKKLVKKALNAAKQDLPISLDMWSLGMDPNGQRLSLSTPTWEMGDGSYLSQVWLTIEEEGLKIHSSSDIDPEAQGSGIVVNGGERVPFSRIESGKIAIVDGDWMNRLSDGGMLEIYLGFFPGKNPPSPTFKSDASLDALTRLVPTYQQLVN